MRDGARWEAGGGNLCEADRVACCTVCEQRIKGDWQLGESPGMAGKAC